MALLLTFLTHRYNGFVWIVSRYLLMVVYGNNNLYWKKLVGLLCSYNLIERAASELFLQKDINILQFLFNHIMSTTYLITTLIRKVLWLLKYSCSALGSDQNIPFVAISWTFRHNDRLRYKYGAVLYTLIITSQFYDALLSIP